MRRARSVSVLTTAAVAAALNGLLTPSHAADASVDPGPWKPPAPQRHVILPGVIIRSFYATRIDSMVHVAEIRPGAPVRFQPVAASIPLALGRLRTTSSMCADVDCVVAVNASFRDKPGVKPRGGEILTGIPIQLHRTEPDQVVFSTRHPIRMGALHTTVRLRQRGLDPLKVRAINANPDGRGVRLFTAAFAPVSPRGTTVVLRLAARSPVSIGHPYRVEVGPARAYSRYRFTPGTAVLRARGRAAYRLRRFVAALDPAAPVTLATHTDRAAAQSLSTSVRLLRDGKVVVPLQGGRAFVSARNPRTLLAWRANHAALLITIDGRRTHDLGATLPQAAELAGRLGAVGAVNLDGGGSTTFVVRGQVRNRPSDGPERPVVNAITLVHDPEHPFEPNYYARHP